MTATDWIAFTQDGEKPHLGQRILVATKHSAGEQTFDGIVGSLWTHWMPFIPPEKPDPFEEWWNGQKVHDFAGTKKFAKHAYEAGLKRGREEK